MSFFSNILDSTKRKFAEAKERQEFLAMVEGEAKPLRRRAYMRQVMKDVVKEGEEMAKADSAKKMQKKKTPQDFGMGKPLEDPMKFLNPKQTKSKGKKK